MWPHRPSWVNRPVTRDSVNEFVAHIDPIGSPTKKGALGANRGPVLERGLVPGSSVDAGSRCNGFGRA
jgi:hypothetical protein